MSGRMQGRAMPFHLIFTLAIASMACLSAELACELSTCRIFGLAIVSNWQVRL